MQEEGIKILKAEITNFKNISHKTVVFEGRSAIIIAPNAGGKSSLIQAIQSPINSKIIPLQPVKEGEERGSVELLVGGKFKGESVKYNIGLYFSPEHQKGRITITNEDGGKVPGGKSVINDIVGNISFNMMEFLRLARTDAGGVSDAGRKKQVEILKALLPDEVVDKMAELDVERKKVYNERSTVNAEVKVMKTNLEGHEYTLEDIENYSTKKDGEAIRTQINGLSTSIEKHSKATSAQARFMETISFKEEQIACLQKELDVARHNLNTTNEWLQKNEKPSIGHLSAQLKDIDDHNAICDEIAKLEKSRSDMDTKSAESDKKTERMKEIDKEKAEVFASSPLPVPGLAFDENMVTYKGLPLDEDQHSTAMLIGIGIRIGMAMNPNLKLLVIKDGSLLDRQTLRFIMKICEEQGYQVLIEKVDFEGENEEVTVEFTESEEI